MDAEQEAPRAGITIFNEAGDIRPLASIEADVIVRAIDHYKGQMSEVARRLAIGRSTLYRKAREYGIPFRHGRRQ